MGFYLDIDTLIGICISLLGKYHKYKVAYTKKWIQYLVKKLINFKKKFIISQLRLEGQY